MFRYDIQGLRALAVFLVFIFHLNNQFLSGGFIGVDIFFVISGFLITGNILKLKHNKSFKFIDFYIGRFKRLLPVFFSILIVTVILGVFIYSPSEVYLLKRNLFNAVIFNSNNYFASLDNYFGTSNTENPLLHTWTLAIEMQFYFLLPILLICINTKYLKLTIVSLFVILLAYSNLQSYYLNNIEEMYFSLPARMPEFLMGSIIVLYKNQLQKTFGNIKLSNYLAILSVLIIIVSSAIFNEEMKFPGMIVLLPITATSILLLSNNSWVNTKLLSNKLMVHIGELSYSIYLWHWVIMAYLRYYKVEYEFTVVENLLIIGITYILSYVTYQLVENRFRSVSNKKILVILSFQFITLAVGIYSLTKLNQLVNFIPTEYLKPNINMESHNGTFKKTGYLGAIEKKNDSILLIGDSHAFIYKNLLETLGKEYNFNFRTVTNNLYPPLQGFVRDDFTNQAVFDQYVHLSNITSDEIKKSKYIILSSVWTKKVRNFEEVFFNFITSLQPNQKVIILQDFPNFKKNPFRVNKGYQKIKNYDKSLINYSPKIPEYVDRYVDNKKVYYLKINFEKFNQDLPFYNNKIMYFDDGHLNTYGVNVLAQLEGKKIAEEILDIISD